MVVVFSNFLTKYWQDLNLGHLPLYQTLQKSWLYCAFHEIQHNCNATLLWYLIMCLIQFTEHRPNGTLSTYSKQESNRKLWNAIACPQVKFLYNHRMNLVGNTCCYNYYFCLFSLWLFHNTSQVKKINKCVWFCLFIRWDPSSQACCTYWFNPLTPKISLVILPNVCYMVPLMLVWRIWY